MQTVTVDELYEALGQARKDGLGKKKILLSNDDEGNGYHECFFTVATDLKKFRLSLNDLPYGVDIDEAENDYVIIG